MIMIRRVLLDLVDALILFHTGSLMDFTTCITTTLGLIE